MKRKCFLAFSLFVILFLFLPQILSSPIGKPLFVWWVGKKLKGELSIDKFSLHWFSNQSFEKISFENQKVSAQIASLFSPVPLWSLKEIKYAFSMKQGEFRFPSLENDTLFTLEASLKDRKIQVEGHTNVGGSVSIQGLWNQTQQFDLKGSFHQIPLVLLESLYPAQEPLLKYLGPVFNLEGHLRYDKPQGDIECLFETPRFSSNLSAKITPQGIVLKTPWNLLATLEMGPHPLLGNLRGKAHVTLSPEGFLLPLPFRWEALSVQKGWCDLGKMSALGDSSFFALFSLLKAPLSNPLSIWFAPTSFSLTQGTLNIERLDFLLSTIHLCLWGNVDLPSQKLFGFLGLPADTLQNAFNLPFLKETYVLKIPVRGNLKNPDIDTSKASSKIATWIAAEQLPKLGGPKGRFFGKLLNPIVHPQEEEGVPLAKRPFPWESKRG